jgi:hypothetical protein
VARDHEGHLGGTLLVSVLRRGVVRRRSAAGCGEVLHRESEITEPQTGPPKEIGPLDPPSRKGGCARLRDSPRSNPEDQETDSNRRSPS